MNPMLEIARRRYTAKHYDPAKSLSDEDLHDLLEIMRLAPSSGGSRSSTARKPSTGALMRRRSRAVSTRW